ncbi:MAG: chromosomal replication initiator DnaA [Paracoccaceae bacterium]
MSTIEQLVLDLPVRRAQGRDDFFVAPNNALALAMLDAPEKWPLHRLVLHGPKASGKSHLLNIWADERGAVRLDGTQLANADIAALITAPWLAIDVADAVADDPAAQTALFHLLNGRMARQAPMLMAARQPGARWGVALPDLQSRLAASAQAELLAPDDAMLAALLVKLFADRQINVEADLVPYLINRIDRSFAAAIASVVRLDRAALSRKTRLTARFAGKVLAQDNDA